MVKVDFDVGRGGDKSAVAKPSGKKKHGALCAPLPSSSQPAFLPSLPSSQPPLCLAFLLPTSRPIRPTELLQKGAHRMRASPTDMPVLTHRFGVRRFLKEDSRVCDLVCDDGARFKVRCGIKGNLLEMNPRLAACPDAINNKPGQARRPLPVITSYCQLLLVITTYYHLLPLTSSYRAPAPSTTSWARRDTP